MVVELRYLQSVELEQKNKLLEIIGMSRRNMKNPLTLLFLVEQAVLHYNMNVARNDLQIKIVDFRESQFIAGLIDNKVDRNVFMAPVQAEFSSDELNTMVSEFAIVLGKQVQTVGYFYYFYNRLSMGWIDIGGTDDRFSYSFDKLTSVVPEEMESWNKLLFFPSIAIAEFVYRTEGKGCFVVQSTIKFTELSDFGFDPLVHLNEEELNWKRRKERKRAGKIYPIIGNIVNPVY